MKRRMLLLVLLVVGASFAVGSPADSASGLSCPGKATKGEVSELAGFVGDVKVGVRANGVLSDRDVHWYSWDLPKGDHRLLLQANEDLDLVVCDARTGRLHSSCSANYGPVGEGCFETGKGDLWVFGHPGLGTAVTGPMRALVGVRHCQGSGNLCTRLAPSVPTRYVLIAS